jgi:hypothetical protein
MRSFDIDTHIDGATTAISHDTAFDVVCTVAIDPRYDTIQYDTTWC